MKKNKKLIYSLILLVAVGYIFLHFILGFMVKTAVETVAPRLTGTPVSVGRVRLSPLTGSGTIKNFVIGNPEGFNTEFAISVGRIYFDLKLTSLLLGKIVVKDIIVESPEISYEQGLTSGSNISTILANLSSDESKESTEEESLKEEKEGTKVIIEHFLLTGGMVRLSAKFLLGVALPVPLPPIELHDIGKESDGQYIGETIKEVFGAIAMSIQDVIVKANPLFKEGADTLKGAVKGGGKKVLEGGKQLFRSIKGFFEKEDE